MHWGICHLLVTFLFLQGKTITKGETTEGRVTVPVQCDCLITV